MNAYKFNNLVYVPLTKHASTSYTKLFRDVLKWDSYDINSIDWDSDKVFAHIIHPYDRHLKGITQCVVKYDLWDLVPNPKFQTLLSTAVFDLHSYPLYATFGENVNKIDWLLLDHPELSGNFITTRFLESNGVHINESDIPHENLTTDQRKKNLELRISNLRGSEPILKGTLGYFYGNDSTLYENVLGHTRFEDIATNPYHECSWLTNRDRNA